MTDHERHGGPYDRGGADFYYGRPRKPHYFKGPSYSSEMVGEEHMTEGETKAYNKGYGDETETKFSH